MPSDKITSKNLSYDQKLPPFLARLHGQHVSGDSSPDPILAARRRPGKVRSASEEAEDAPLVVDEDGNVVDLKVAQEDEEEEAQKDGNKTNDAVDAGEEEEELREKEKVAGIGAARKRKAGKIIGGDDAEDAQARVDSEIAKAVKASRAVLGRKDPKQDNTAAPQGAGKPAVGEGKGERGEKTRKKAKKIKLSFGDDEV